jgi:hypothetical protein
MEFRKIEWRETKYGNWRADAPFGLALSVDDETSGMVWRLTSYEAESIARGEAMSMDCGKTECETAYLKYLADNIELAVVDASFAKY